MGTTLQEMSDQVMALLKNAKKVAISRQDRRLAMDILKACALYAKGLSFPCDPQIFTKLANSIVDKQNLAIIEEFAKVEKTLGDSFSRSTKRTWRTIRLPK